MGAWFSLQHKQRHKHTAMVVSMPQHKYEHLQLYAWEE